MRLSLFFSFIFCLFAFTQLGVEGVVGVLTKDYVGKARWKHTIKKLYIESECNQGRTYGCFDLGQKSCEEVSSGIVEQCIADLDSEIPYFIFLPEGDLEHGEKVNQCYGEKLLASYPFREDPGLCNAAAQKAYLESTLEQGFEILASRIVGIPPLLSGVPELKKEFYEFYLSLPRKNILEDQAKIGAFTGEMLRRLVVAAPDQEFVKYYKETVLPKMFLLIENGIDKCPNEEEMPDPSKLEKVKAKLIEMNKIEIDRMVSLAKYSTKRVAYYDRVEATQYLLDFNNSRNLDEQKMIKNMFSENKDRCLDDTEIYKKILALPVKRAAAILRLVFELS